MRKYIIGLAALALSTSGCSYRAGEYNFTPQAQKILHEETNSKDTHPAIGDYIAFAKEFDTNGDHILTKYEAEQGLEILAARSK